MKFDDQMRELGQMSQTDDKFGSIVDTLNRVESMMEKIGVGKQGDFVLPYASQPPMAQRRWKSK